MIDNNQPDHCRYADVDKIPKREMIMRFKILDNQGNELEIQKINQQSFQQVQFGQMAAIVDKAENIDSLLAEKNDKYDRQHDERGIECPLQNERNRREIIFVFKDHLPP